MRPRPVDAYAHTKRSKTSRVTEQAAVACGTSVVALSNLCSRLSYLQLYSICCGHLLCLETKGTVQAVATMSINLHIFSYIRCSTADNTVIFGPHQVARRAERRSVPWSLEIRSLLIFLSCCSQFSFFSN